MAKKAEITTTYQELRSAVPALDSLMQKPLKAANALQVSRLVKMVNGELETFNEQHRTLIVKHGGMADENGDLRVPQTAVTEFNIEFTEMVLTEIVLSARPLSIKVLDDVTITAVEMMALEFLFED